VLALLILIKPPVAVGQHFLRHGGVCNDQGDNEAPRTNQ
jgi:hypothetical protein